MGGTSQPEWDLDQLKQQIRAQAAAMRERAASSLPLTPHASILSSYNWLEVKARLKSATGQTKLGELPLLHLFHGVKRRVALTVARGVLYLTRFLTNRQSELNVCLHDVLFQVAEAVNELELRAVQQQERIRLLEETIDQLRLRHPTKPTHRGDEIERKAS